MRTWFVPSSIVPWLIRTRTTHISFFSSSISHSQPPTSISNPTSKPISDSQIYSLSSLFLDNPNTNTSFPKKSRSETGFSASTEPPRCEFTESISQKKSLEQTHVIKVLLSQRNDPDSALNYFKWAEKQRGFARGIVDPFCVLLCILVGSPSHHQIARNMLNRYVLGDSSPSSCVLVDHLVDCLKRFEFDSDSRIFNYLLNSYVRAGRFNDSFDCLDRMIESNIEPWVMCINVFLTALVRKNMIAEARGLYNNVVSRGVNYDCCTIETMMRACLNDGKADEAERYFWEAKASFIKLDAANYSTAIQAVCRKPNSNVACELLNEMTKMGWLPSVGTFACIIGACVKQGNMVDALKVKDEMVSSGKPMNLIVATSLMKGYYMAGDLDSALNLFNKIVRDGLEPNMVTYSVLIEGCFRGGKMEKASELCTQMKLAGIQPSVYIVNSLIRGFFGVHQWEEAFKHFDEAVECGIANVFTYNNMICWLCKEGKVDEACSGKILFASELYTDMLSNGIVPDEVTYTVLVHGLCNKGQLENAHKVLEEMDKKSMAPNVLIYNTLIAGYFKEGNLQEAFRLHDEMLDRGVVPDDTTYDILLSEEVECFCPSLANQDQKTNDWHIYFQAVLLNLNCPSELSCCHLSDTLLQ
ncbi:Pentatricopeptide repeat-containing protein [Camellia lanceoleosa]|uniref:Pentatricopeptide repeat-containing protein n=1 Tax=Camellia lanceoleosa TaxID=1840588 RepID=A0ACC0FLH3_9ERIC|nr:Pentatricopeptide repeat-containing protein [Camellia lanceoleosa]